MELKTYFAQDASGNIMPGATVMVYEAATTTLATGLQDESGAPLANPFTADSSAKVAFYAPDGLYDITVVGNGRTVTIRAQFVSVDGASVLRSDLAATGGAALVGFQQVGAGAIARTVEDEARSSVFAAQFGADPTGATDSSAAIIAALASHPHVIVTPGNYRCDQMIEINAGKTLELRGGATLRRYAAHSASTDPVVWIKGSGASFYGAGQGTSFVASENRAPRGVVRLGHKDMTESHANVTYCTLTGMTIVGKQAYGQTTGDPDVALYMPNPQFGGLVSYFHNVSGLRLQNANFGLWLHGYANANTISNIQGYTIGNTTLGANKNAFVYCNGALDNAFTNSFFSQSTNSIGLLVDDFDNTSNGGSVHACFANMFTNMVFEQGGASAYGVKLLSGSRNVFIVRDNVALGNSIAVPTNYIHGLSDSITAAGLSSRGGVVAATYLEAGTDVRALGSVREGDSFNFWVAKKAKRAAVTNASTLTFTLSCAAQAGLWRHGYIRITASGGDVGSNSASTLQAVYAASALNQAFPTLGAVKNAVGDTAAFTISMSDDVLTIATTLDALVAEVEFGFTTVNVNVS